MEINNPKLKSLIESLLFIANRPLTKKELAQITGENEELIEGKLEELIEEYKTNERGIKIIQNGKDFQMVTDPENSQTVQKFLKEEVNQELTPASLETLSIIAYRGPIKKEELEQIRGVNCSMILRHLLIKGLIVEEDEENRIYNVSLNFIRHLGINDLKELPDYDKLNRDISLSSLMEKEE